jgi:hypothetical protein
MANLLDLPCEIRNALYEELLGSDSNPDRRNQNELATFSVSRQLHDESSSYFYQHNALTIDAPSTATHTATVLPPISDRYLRYLRRLTIHALVGQSTLSCTRKVATAIAALAGIGAQFTELNILIQSPQSRVLNSRVDDSVMDSNHAITEAIRTVLRSNVTNTFRIQLKGAWFAPGVAQALKAEFSSQLEFVADNNTLVINTSALERPLTGRYSSTHLTELDLSDEDISDISSHEDSDATPSTPSTLPSSLNSAFSKLDTFSVPSFGLSFDEDEDKDHNNCVTEYTNSNEPFFNDDDIEAWSVQEEQGMDNEEILGDMEDLDEDEDEEMDDVDHEGFQAIVHNLEEVGHHMANDEDVTYMTNFAPDLLLSRHHLGNLM